MLARIMANVNILRGSASHTRFNMLRKQTHADCSTYGQAWPVACQSGHSSHPRSRSLHDIHLSQQIGFIVSHLFRLTCHVCVCMFIPSSYLIYAAAQDNTPPPPPSPKTHVCVRLFVLSRVLSRRVASCRMSRINLRTLQIRSSNSSAHPRGLDRIERRAPCGFIQMPAKTAT